MELTQHGFLDELLAPRRDLSSNWTTFASSADFFPNTNNHNQWSFDSFENPSLLASPNPSSFINGFSEPTLDCNPFTNYPSFADTFTVPDFEPSSYEEGFTLPPQEQSFGETKCSVNQVKVEQNYNNNDVGVFNKMEMNKNKKKNKSKKVEGQPSKNLMAERRRRKRLNDRLTMLRSIVPKISKMDRTSILGDTIDYMKELLERTNKLQEEESEVGMMNLLGDFKESKPNEVLVRNSPKFDVVRRDLDTKVEICCGTKPGLLLSTVSTLEALGLEVQQCVISCFNDFSLKASCSEAAEQRPLISCEEIKQALFRNAGYGGRCM